MMKERKQNRPLLIGLLGNLLCWCGDALLSVFPGQETVSGFELSESWIGAPLWRFSLSGTLGSIAMVLVLIGFYRIYQLLKPNAPKTAKVFLGGALLGCIPGAGFHLQCTTAAWFYDALGGTAEAAETVTRYFLQHSALTILCSAGLLLASAVLLAAVVRGKTRFPRWAAVFNIMVIMAVLSLFRPIVSIPGTMNLGGAGMFLGLWLLTRKEDREVNR